METDRHHPEFAERCIPTGPRVFRPVELERVPPAMISEAGRIQACTPAAEPPRWVAPEE